MDGDAHRPTGNGAHEDRHHGDTSPDRVPLRTGEGSSPPVAELWSPNKERYEDFSGLFASMRNKLSTLISKTDTEGPDKGSNVSGDHDHGPPANRNLSPSKTDTEGPDKDSNVSGDHGPPANRDLSPSKSDTEDLDKDSNVVWDLNTETSAPVEKLSSENPIPSSEGTESEAVLALGESTNMLIVNEMAESAKVDVTTENASSVVSLSDKVDLTTENASSVVSLSDKVDLTTENASSVVSLSDKVDLTTENASSVVSLSDKVDLTTENAGSVVSLSDKEMLETVTEAKEEASSNLFHTDGQVKTIEIPVEMETGKIAKAVDEVVSTTSEMNPAVTSDNVINLTEDTVVNLTGDVVNLAEDTVVNLTEDTVVNLTEAAVVSSDLQETDMQKKVKDDIQTEHISSEREMNVDAASENIENKEGDAIQIEVSDAMQENVESASVKMNDIAVEDIGKEVTDTMLENKNNSVSSECLDLTCEIEGTNPDMSVATMGELHLPAEVDKEGVEMESEGGDISDLNVSSNNNMDAVTDNIVMHGDISELEATSVVTASISNGLALDMNMVDNVQGSSDEMKADHEDESSVSMSGTDAAVNSIGTMEDVESRRPVKSAEVMETDDNKDGGIAEYTSEDAEPDQTDHGPINSEEEMDMDDVWTSTNQSQDSHAEHRVGGTVESTEQDVNEEVSISKECDDIDMTEHTVIVKSVTDITDHEVVNDDGSSPAVAIDALQDIMQIDKSMEKHCSEKIIEPEVSNTLVGTEASIVKDQSNTLVGTEASIVKDQSISLETDLEEPVEGCAQANKKGDVEGTDNDQSKNSDVSANDGGLALEPSKSSSWCQEGGLMITNVRSLSNSGNKTEKSGDRETECTANTNRETSSQQVDDSPTVSAHTVRNEVSSVKNVDSEIMSIATTVEPISMVPASGVMVTTASKHINASINNSPVLSLHSGSSQTATNNLSNSANTNSDIQTSLASQPSLDKEPILPIISSVFSVKQEVETGEEYGVMTPTEPVRNVQTTIPALHTGRVVTAWKGNARNPPKIFVTKVCAATSVSSSKLPLMNKVPTVQKTSVHAAVSNANSAVSQKPSRISLMPLSQKTGVNVVTTNQSAPIIVNISKVGAGQRIFVPLTSESVNEKVKLGPLAKAKSSVLNIDTIGASKITELIARKNPIPIFKPEPPPKSVKDYRTYPCYECGDSFNHESSLAIHTSRCSMKLTYKCDYCDQPISFTNKCQLLGHLRFHMNLDKTRAVPIHIKSDSIEITTFYNELVKSNKYKWHSFHERGRKDPEGGQITKPGGKSPDEVHSVVYSCVECSQCFNSTSARTSHFQGNFQGNPKSQTFFCDICPMYMNSKCAMTAHKRLHKLADINCEKILVCPECGIRFKLTSIEDFFDHILMFCFHLSRLNSFRCLKCQALISSSEGIEQHLMLNMEHYYKCQLCPMALKSVHAFQQHFSLKHSDIEASAYKTYAKIIYRCHVCDSLIDDRAFLTSHSENHKQQMKATAFERLHCLRCGQNFASKRTLSAHFKAHGISAVKRKTYCTFCSKTFTSYYTYIQHTMSLHTQCLPKVLAKFCEECGLVCSGHAQYQVHACLAAKKITVLGDETLKKTKTAEKSKAGKNITPRQQGSVQYECIIPSDIPDHLSKNCKSCGEMFLSAAMRANHIKRHREKQIYICPWCDRMDFPSYNDLRSHEIACEAIDKHPAYSHVKSKKKRSSTSDKQLTQGGAKTIKAEVQPEMTFKCDHCSQLFTRKSLQEEHMKSEHGFHPCHLCGLIFHSQSSLKKHIMLNHEGKKLVYYCWVCRGRKIYKHFSEKSRLEKHLSLKHRLKHWDVAKIVAELPGLDGSGGSPEPPKILQPENKEAPEGSPAMKKLRVEGEAIFKCAKCSFTCETKEPFLEHILVHKAENTVQCFECGLCFAVFSSLKKHLFMVHKVRDFDTYLKDNKIEEFEAEEDIDVEIDDIKREPIKREPADESSGEEEVANPLECKVCYKMFDSEHVLRSHIRTHGMAFIKKSRRRGLLQKKASTDSNIDIIAVPMSDGGSKRSSEYVDGEKDDGREVMEESEPKKRRIEAEIENL